MSLSDKQINQINQMDSIFKEIGLGEMLSKLDSANPSKKGSTDIVKTKDFIKGLTDLKTEMNEKINSKFEELKVLIEKSKGTEAEYFK